MEGDCGERRESDASSSAPPLALALPSLALPSLCHDSVGDEGASDADSEDALRLPPSVAGKD
jgi:hypothetical protein